MAKTTLDRFHFISFSDSRWIHSHPGSMVLSQETFILSIFSVPLASASPSALQPVCQIAGGDVAGALSDGYRQRLIGVHGNIRYCRIHVWRGSRSFVLFSKRPSRHTRPRVSVKRCELSSFSPRCSPSAHATETGGAELTCHGQTCHLTIAALLSLSLS